jgi:Protein of unknown function (DUF1579)
MEKNVSQYPNPAIRDLERFVGEWDMELSNASFLPSPSDTLAGHVSMKWLEGGAFLVMYMGGQPRGTPDAIWLIGRDESTSRYMVLYYDNRAVSRVYEMSFSEGIWKMWRNAPDFSQRFEGKFSEDGNTITAHWENSSDGSTWEHDFDVTYTKVK